MSAPHGHSKHGKRAAAVAAGAAVALFAVASIALGAQLGANSFDPSSFFDSADMRRQSAEYGTAYDVSRTEANGQANMDDQDGQDESQQPDVQQLDAALFSQDDNSGSSALTVVDHPTGTTVVTGQGEEGGSPNGTVTGPVINGGDGQGDGTADTPSGPTPAPTDPDPAPTLPKDLYGQVTGTPAPAYPGSGLPEAKSATLTVITEEFASAWDLDELGLERLYRGMVLNKQKILCAAYYYVEVDGTRYRLEAFDENFTVSAVPPTLNSDSLELTFRFRPNANSEWVQETASLPVHFCKVLVQGWNEGEYLQTLYPDAGASVDLGNLYYSMLPEEATADPFSTVYLDRIFTGWAEEGSNTSVGPVYTPQSIGRIVLTPLPYAPVPSDFIIASNFGSQTLVGYSGAGPVCDIPEGVQTVGWATYLIEADIIRIPKSLQTMEGWEMMLCADRAYEVDEGNPAYRVQDGLLLRTADNAVAGIPVGMEAVEVPEGTTSVSIPYQNKISEIRFSGDPIDANLSFLNNADVVVPADRYLDYLVAWGSNPGNETNSLVPDSGEKPDYQVIGKGVYSQDGTTLYQALGDAAGVFVVADGVTTVKAGAFAECPYLEALVLPESTAVLEEGALAGFTGSRVLFSGATAPSIGADALGYSLQTSLSARNAYLQSWGALLGEGAVAASLQANDFAIMEVSGYTVLQDSLRNEDGTFADNSRNQAILLGAPADAQTFSGNVPGVEKLTGINAGAFENCDDLWLVELPESVKEIGREAFKGCSSLQGFFSASTDTISIGASAFSECYSLQAAAFSAQTAAVEDYNSLVEDGFSAYAPYQSVGYNDPDAWTEAFFTLCPEYRFEVQGGGVILYGSAPNDEGYRPGTYALAATAGISGKVVLAQGTTVIDDYAFSACTESPFTLDAESMSQLTAIGDSAFYSWGNTVQLTGDVVLPASLDYLGSYAFRNSAIASVHIDGSSLPEIREGTFLSCSSLQTATFGDACAVGTIGVSAFSESGIAHINLPDSLERLGNGSFSSCPNLTDITLPAGVTNIEPDVFTWSGISTATITSPEAPQLNLYSLYLPYQFTDNPDFRIVLAGEAEGKEAAYTTAWKAALMGYEDTSQMTDAEELEGINKARELFGLDPLEALPLTGMADELTPDGTGWEDGVMGEDDTADPPAAYRQPSQSIADQGNASDSPDTATDPEADSGNAGPNAADSLLPAVGSETEGDGGNPSDNDPLQDSGEAAIAAAAKAAGTARQAAATFLDVAETRQNAQNSG